MGQYLVSTIIGIKNKQVVVSVATLKTEKKIKAKNNNVYVSELAVA